MRCLIVAADDFGLTRSVNEGIIKACREGIVTSVNLMPTGEAFEDAVKRLGADLKSNEAGAHLALTETAPSAKATNNKALVDSNGRFHKGYGRFFLNFFSGKISRDEIYAELKAQLELLKATGVRPIYLSSHEHIHLMPDILKIFIVLAKEYDIPSIRYLHEKPKGFPNSIKDVLRRAILPFFSGITRKMLDESGISHTENSLGFFDSGEIYEGRLEDMLKNLREGVTELICHPGFLGPEVLEKYRFHINCERELAAVTSRSVKKILEEEKIALVPYSKLGYVFK